MPLKLLSVLLAAIETLCLHLRGQVNISVHHRADAGATCSASDAECLKPSRQRQTPLCSAVQRRF